MNVTKEQRLGDLVSANGKISMAQAGRERGQEGFFSLTAKLLAALQIPTLLSEMVLFRPQEEVNEK